MSQQKYYPQLNSKLNFPEMEKEIISYWTEQNMPVFKHSVFLNYEEEFFEHKISQMINIAINECEKNYPIFKVVMTKGMNPKDALYPLMMETIGQA